MKIHQNWLGLSILLLKKKGRHFSSYFSKGNFRRKTKLPILVTVTLTKWTFFSIRPIWMIFMEGIDFEIFLQKKGKKRYYGHFGTLLDLCPNPARYQNDHRKFFFYPPQTKKKKVLILKFLTTRFIAEIFFSNKTCG